MRACKGGAGNGVIEGLGLRLGGWWSCESCAGFCWGRSGAEKIDLLGYGATKVIEGFSKVGRVVVGLVGVL